MFSESKIYLKHFINCAKTIESNIVKSSSKNYKGVKWYLSTDKQSVSNKLTRKFPSKIIIGDGIIGHISTNENSYQRTILDNEMLSRCDELIVTAGSTFGNNCFDDLIKKVKNEI